MSSRSLRQRTSRLSSPALFSDKETSTVPVEAPAMRNGQQTTLTKWMEPAVRPAVPSFEDTRGLERVGVLENMQPLGVPPSQRLLQKLKLNYIRPSSRATPVQTDDVNTPVAEPDKMDFPSPVEPEPDPNPVPDLPPVSRRTSDTIVISSPPRGRPSRKEVAEMSQIVAASPSPVKVTATPGGSQASPRPASIQAHLRQDRLQTHIERAIQEAYQQGSPDLALGLQKLRDDAHVVPDLWTVLDAVIHQSPSAAQFKIFKRYIKSGLKSFRDSSAPTSPYQVMPPRDHARSLEHLSHSPSAGHPHRNSISAADNPIAGTALFFNHLGMPGMFQTQDMPPISTAALRGAQSGDLTASHARQHGPSPHKRKRSRSVSTSSSLSSAKSLPEEFGPSVDRDGRGHGRGSSGRSGSGGQRQAASRSLAGNSRLRSAASAANSQQSTAKISSADAPTAAKASSKKQKKIRDEPEFDIEELATRKRRLLDDSFRDYNAVPRPESDEREMVHGLSGRLAVVDNGPGPSVHPDRASVAHDNLASPTADFTPLDRFLANGTRRKRGYDDIDADELENTTPESSSPAPLLVPPPPATAFLASRGATPRAARAQPAAKTRKSARVMVSPNKPKNGGPTAGVSRGGPGRDNMVSNGAESNAEDNDEFCASCGGEGKLLCCDGCPNSFHHSCLEPPLNPDDEVEGEWYCPRCLSRRSKQKPHPTGVLGLASNRTHETIPKAFALPHPVREYFEGVRTGDEGEYEDIGLPRTQNHTVKMNRAGFIEEPNYKETRDSKGKLILCYRCGLSSNGRDIIPCDYCPARWHLDCVDPPLAVPPRRRIGDKPSTNWRCPLHVEHDLISISRQAEAAPGDVGRVPRLRKPKHAVPLDVGVARGFKNNGIIEVELMKDDHDFDKTKEVHMHGKVHRIPEMGIRLDFIDRVKRSWYEDQSFPRLLNAPKRIRNRLYRPDRPVLHHPAEEVVYRYEEPDFWTGASALAIAETAKANAVLHKKSFREQQTVLNLAEMSQQGSESYSGDALAELTNQLIAEAPEEVVSAVEQSEIDQLRHLQELINKRLAVLEHDRGQPTPPSPSTAVHAGDWVEPPSPAAAEDSVQPKMVNGDTIEVDGANEAQKDEDGNDGDDEMELEIQMEL